MIFKGILYSIEHIKKFKITGIVVWIFYCIVIVISMLLNNTKHYSNNSNSQFHVYFILFLSYGLFSLIFSIYLLGKNNFVKLFSLLFIIIFLLCMFFIQVEIIITYKINVLPNLLIVLSIFFIILIISLVKIYNFLGFTIIDKIYAIFLGLIVYMILIIDGGLILFLYYDANKYINSEYINAFKVMNGPLDILKALTSISIDKFFNYTASSSPTPLSFKLPYFAGKFLDSFLLVYIFSRVTASNPKNSLLYKLNNLKNENKLLKEKNKKLNKASNFLFISYLYAINKYNSEIDQIKIKYENKFLNSKSKNKKNRK